MKKNRTIRSLLPTALIIAVIIFTWWLPASINPHLIADDLTAHLLQWPLAKSHLWQTLCAFLNTDLFDGAMYAAIIAFMICACRKVAPGKRLGEIKRFFLYYLLLSVAQYGFKHLLHATFHYCRLSPSLALKDAVRVSPHAIHIYFKDASRRSFPGDHALFLFSWAMFWLRGYPLQMRAVALFIAMLFSLPRLLLGGHWLSDLTLGGILPAWIFARCVLEQGPLALGKGQSL